MSEKNRDQDRLRFESALSQLRPVANDVDRERVFFEAGKVFADSQRKDRWKTAAAFAMALSLVLSVMLVVQQSRLTHLAAALHRVGESDSAVPIQKHSKPTDTTPGSSDTDVDADGPERLVEPDLQFALVAMRQKLFDDSANRESNRVMEPKIASDVFDPQQSYRLEIIRELEKEILQTEE